MIRSKFNYLKVAAALAVMAITLTPSPRAATAKSALLRAGIPNADLTREERVLSRYLDELFAYEKECAQVGKRARLVNEDLEPVQRKSEDLKRRLPGVQDAIREIVRKLKAANEWTDLDTNIAARLTDARDKSYFQENSLKKLLEGASNNLTSHASEISAPVDNLRRRLTSRTFAPYGEARIINAAYAPAPYAGSGLTCLMANVRLGLAWRIGGREETSAQNQRICACSGGTAAMCTNAAT